MRPVFLAKILLPALQMLRRFRACCGGVTAIEFAFVAPLIVGIMLVTVQVGVIFVAQSYLGTISESAMRLVLTNQANALTKDQFKAKICSDYLAAMFNCSNLIVDLEAAPTSVAGMASAMPTFDANGNLVNPTSFNVVAAPSKMMLIVMYQWPIIAGPLMNWSNVGNGSFLLVSTQVFQIEPTS